MSTKKSKPDFVTVVYFTDAHNQPEMSQERFVWLAEFVNEMEPDYLVDGGDFDDFQSLCSHERNETLKGRLKPSLMRDLECSAQARKLINDTLKVPVKKFVTMGNHEVRIWTYENNNPEVEGMAGNMYEDILRAAGWDFRYYGEYLTLHGVDFTHIPFTGMGKPVGGDNPTKNIAEKSLFDVVYGHTHALQTATAHKFGLNRSVTAFNAGCFMPEGYIPAYTKDTRKEFWYGAHHLTIRNGRILAIKSYSMFELEKLYKR